TTIRAPWSISLIKVAITIAISVGIISFGRGASRSPTCLSDKASHGPWVYGLQVIGLLGFKTMFEQFGRLRCPVVGLACRKTGQRPLVRLGESRHAIAPGSLGSVKHFIGHGNQGESGRLTCGENRSHAQADGQMIG